MKTSDNINNKILRYLNGEMNSDEIREFEAQMSNDPFLSDAIEGYRISGAHPDDLPPLKINPSENKKPNLFRVLIGIGVAASIILLAMYVLHLKTGKTNLSGNDESKPQIVIEDKNRIVDSTIKIDTIVEFEEPEKPYISEIRVKPQKFVVPESIAPLHINKEIIVDYDIHESEIDQIYKFRSNHYYAYIDGLKIVDYRYDYRKNSAFVPILENDTEVIFRPNVLAPSTETTYLEFLESALLKYKEKGYRDAIADFNLILEQYPNDANALFYKALCYYEIDRNDISLRLFEKSLNSKINTFHEESKWYRGLILKEEMQYAAAEKVLEEIVKDNGYYGVQAQKELDELYKLYINE